MAAAPTCHGHLIRQLAHGVHVRIHPRGQGRRGRLLLTVELHPQSRGLRHGGQPLLGLHGIQSLHQTLQVLRMPLARPLRNVQLLARIV
jgi:hypothetical protein